MIGDAFEPGMGYVAMSRVRTSGGLSAALRMRAMRTLKGSRGSFAGLGHSSRSWVSLLACFPWSELPPRLRYVALRGRELFRSTARQPRDVRYISDDVENMTIRQLRNWVKPSPATHSRWTLKLAEALFILVVSRLITGICCFSAKINVSYAHNSKTFVTSLCYNLCGLQTLFGDSSGAAFNELGYGARWRRSCAASRRKRCGFT